MGHPNSKFLSVKYASALSGVSYDAGTSTASVAQSNLKTVCCR